MFFNQPFMQLNSDPGHPDSQSGPLSGSNQNCQSTVSISDQRFKPGLIPTFNVPQIGAYSNPRLSDSPNSGSVYGSAGTCSIENSWSICYYRESGRTSDNAEIQVILRKECLREKTNQRKGKHTSRKVQVRRPGLEPGFRRWQRLVITTTLSAQMCSKV